MNDMEKCTIYQRRGDKCTISCKLGLWSVEGEYGLELINEATRYFEQYKADGEYSEILGGRSSIDALTEQANMRKGG